MFGAGVFGAGVSDETEDEGASIVDLVPILAARSAGEPIVMPITRKLARLRCDHWATEIDDVARTVQCRKCGTFLDPIDAILALAKRFDEVKWLLSQKRDLLREIETLKAERVKLRGSVRGMAKRRA